MLKKAILTLFLLTGLLADNLLDGFDEEDISREKVLVKDTNFEGKFTQAIAYSINNKKPYDGLSSFKSALFLEYNYDLSNAFKFKINANSFYDLSYAIKGREKFSKEDRDALESEIELFDFYIQGELSENLDIKVGRQVVVWGKSDTIRVTDVLNPLDNRRPAMVDIEELRLPTTMIKLDYYHDNWRVTPMMIVEQRENKTPAFGGNFNQKRNKTTKQKSRHKPTFALAVAGEFSGFDVDFYLEEKTKMLGTALNYVYESWLLKSEFAYKDDDLDSLVGFEYRGIADTTLSYDIANKHDNAYQHAFRASSDFFNATLRANYLISLFGKKFDEGGFQRLWFKYDASDAINVNFGVVDYIAGSEYFDAIDDNDMIFVDVVYGF